MTSRLLAVTFAARDPGRLGRFWAALLDREVVADADGILLPGTGGQVGLRFAPNREPRRGPNRLHLHLTSEHSDQDAVVAAAVASGATPLDLGRLPGETHVVLADPEGNELCVIAPDNAYLAGCGLLGEVAGEGSRAVGLFWSEALGWPLVWDQNDETAVQSPLGGTKVAWGGPPVAPLQQSARQWFELTADDPDAEAERLLALGAMRAAGNDGVVLADPGGNELRLRSG